jgi:hypothetical protein
MRPHALALVVALSLIGGTAPSATTPAETGTLTHLRQDAAPLTDAAMEEFLRSARVLRSRASGKGVTGSRRATLSDGVLTHDAHVQTVDEFKQQFQGKKGIEFNFRDNWRFNIAVYRIDRLLGLQLVPVSVERSWYGHRAAFTWWIDDVLMDEGERLKQKLSAPDLPCWSEQMRLLRVLDELIDNSDRNLGNMLITNSWRLWAIDHTRAFRYSKTPRNPAVLIAVDRSVLARLEALEFAMVKEAVGGHINDADVRTLLSRRDGIVAHFKGRGDGALYDRRDPSSGCSRSHITAAGR